MNASAIFAHISGIYDHVDMRNNPDTPSTVLKKLKATYPQLSMLTWSIVAVYLEDTFILYSSPRVVPASLRDNHDHSLAKMKNAIEVDV